MTHTRWYITVGYRSLPVLACAFSNSSVCVCVYVKKPIAEEVERHPPYCDCDAESKTSILVHLISRATSVPECTKVEDTIWKIEIHAHTSARVAHSLPLSQPHKPTLVASLVHARNRRNRKANTQSLIHYPRFFSCASPQKSPALSHKRARTHKQHTPCMGCWCIESVFPCVTFARGVRSGGISK